MDYLGEQFDIELKIWHGNEYNERGERQLADYLDYYRKEKGYLLSFNFNQKKEVGVKEIQVGNKVIVEAVVQGGGLVVVDFCICFYQLNKVVIED